MLSFLYFKKMLESVLCSNIASSHSSGNYLFHKTKYMGRSCLNLVWAINFDRSALETWNKHSWTAIWKPFQVSVPFSIRKVIISYFFFPPFLDVLRSFVKSLSQDNTQVCHGVLYESNLFAGSRFPFSCISLSRYSIFFNIHIKHIFPPNPKDVAHRYATFLCSLGVEI